MEGSDGNVGKRLNVWFFLFGIFWNWYIRIHVYHPIPINSTHIDDVAKWVVVSHFRLCQHAQCDCKS